MAYLGSDDDLVADAALLRPLADEHPGCFILVVVRRVDEVTALVEERVEEFEAQGLVHLTHSHLGPRVTDAHRTEAKRGDVDASERRELAVAAELGRRRRGGRKVVRHD